MSDHTANLGSDRTKLSDLKDITTTTVTTANDSESWDDILNPVPSDDDGMIGILDAYCKMHNKLDFNVSPKERLAMGKMVAGGTPNPFTIQTMASLLEAKRIREGNSFKLPKSFLYYVEGIEEAWSIHQAEEQQQLVKPTLVPNVQAPAATQPRRLSRQQQELADLRRRAEEERKRG
ncbi:hypothetical protein [Paenibacillus sp. 1A_MP2]